MWIFEHIKIRLNPKDKPSISKIERVTGSPVKAKSQVCEIFKSQNLIQVLRFGPTFKEQLGVLHHSFNDIVEGVLSTPPRDKEPDPGFQGVKVTSASMQLSWSCRWSWAWQKNNCAAVYWCVVIIMDSILHSLKNNLQLKWSVWTF